MAARQLSAKKPKHLGYTVGRFMRYLGRHRLLLLAVGDLFGVLLPGDVLILLRMARPVDAVGGQRDKQDRAYDDDTVK